LFRRRRRSDRRVTAERDHLVVEVPRRGRPLLVRWRWDDIDRAVAFKRDLLTTDLICLSFEAHGQSVEVDDESTGWSGLLTHLPERLPGALTGKALLAMVMQPPFAENRTVVFERSPAGPR
jgi:hypothetical protein